MMPSDETEKKYLVRIEERNTFINARPVGEFTDGGFYEFDRQESEKFGRYGTITIVRRPSVDSPLLEDEQYCIFQISDAELQKLEFTNNGYRMRAQDFLRCCAPLDDTDVREVIIVPASYVPESFGTWGADWKYNQMLPMTKEIYFDNGRDVFGPFVWEASEENDDRFLFKANPSFLINIYHERDFEDSAYYTFRAAEVPNDAYYGLDRHILLTDALPAKAGSYDCIDDDSLKKLFVKILSQKTSDKNVKEQIAEAVTSLPESVVSAERRRRFGQMIANGKIADEVLDLIPSIFTYDEKYLETIVNAAEQNANYKNELLRIIKKSDAYSSLVKPLDAEIEKKKDELAKLQADVGNENAQLEKYNGTDALELEKAQKANTSLKSTIDELQGELAALRSRTNEMEVYQNKKKKLETDIRTEQATLDYITQRRNEISQQIEQKVKAAYCSMAIDPALSSLMLKAANDFQKETAKEEMTEHIASLETVSSKSAIVDPVELVDFLYKELTHKAYRPLSRNDVANLLICVASGFLTVLAGAPGTGKTSLVSLLAKILGLGNAECSRYEEIPVEKGWTSRRDLIGYYNPLTKTIEASNKGLFDALSVLNMEAEKNISDFPYLVLLDEANLSPMEYYWADFMGLCDLKKQNRKIALAEDYVFKIPQTLRFIATMNTDHTTEVLSPRLIDRAWIIRLEPLQMGIEDFHEDSLDEEYPLVEFSAFRKIQDLQGTLDTAVAEEFDIIQDLCGRYGLYFSPRMIGMMRKYCLAGQAIMDADKNHYVALDYAVAEKVLPMIDGYGEEYKKFLSELSKECDTSKMPKCHMLLENIIQRGNSNMQYYKFFSL